MPDESNTVLPIAASNSLQGDLGETLVELAVKLAGHAYSRNTGPDFGVDGRIEILRPNGAGRVATGREIAVQAKRGRFVVKRTRRGYSHYFSEAHRNYWLGHSLPVILAWSSPNDDTVRWQRVTEDTIRRTQNGFAVDLPLSSDLASAGEELRALADREHVEPGIGAIHLLVRIDPRGALLDDVAEVGIAALEVSREIAQGKRAVIDVEIEGTDALIAEVDAIADIEAPDIEARRRKVEFEDALGQYRDKATFLSRALNILLREPDLMAFFDRDDEALGRAIELLCDPWGRRVPDGTTLEAWPATAVYWPSVKFDVTEDELQQLFAPDIGLRGTLGLGAASAYLVRDLPKIAVRLGLIPALCRVLVNYAITSSLPDRELLSMVGLGIENWTVGRG